MQLRNVVLLVSAILPAIVLAGTVKTSEELPSSIETEIGVAGCNGCNGIKTFVSGPVAGGLYAVKDERNINTGQRISASIRLGATNRQAGINSSAVGMTNPGFLKDVSASDGHLFEGKVQTDAKHPYRFFLRVHHNSSFRSQNVFVETRNADYLLVPAFSLEGIDSQKNCFSSGCTWDEDYVLPAKLIYSLIETDAPLKILVGNRVSRQIPSVDGLNQSYKMVNAGVGLNIPADFLKAFLETVQKQLGISG